MKQRRAWSVAVCFVALTVVPALAGAGALTATEGRKAAEPSAPVTRTDPATAAVRGGGRALPEDAAAVVSRALGRDDPAYHITRDPAAAPGELTARNQRSGLQARFTPAGKGVVTSGATRLELGLRAWGYGDRLVAPSRLAGMWAADNKVTYPRGDLSEWYVNGPAGLEHGFTLKSPPPVRPGGSLTLELALGGNVAARVTEDADGLALVSRDGTGFGYDHLVVTDAAGMRLPAWLELRGEHTVRVRVRDDHASYPLVIDPLIQQAELTAVDADSGDAFGGAMAFDGDTLVAGAAGDDGGRGAAYVFVKPTKASWQAARQVAKLTSSREQNVGTHQHRGGRLGVSVAISGGTIVVGDPGAPSARRGRMGSDVGAVLVFRRPQGGWRDAVEDANLTARKSHRGAKLGTSVAIDGRTIVAGAPGHRVLIPSKKGAALVFTEPAAGWVDGTESATLAATGKHAVHAWRGRFGAAVAIEGGVIAVGAPKAGFFGLGAGAVFVYERPAAGWARAAPTALLRASNPKTARELGASVAIDGDVIVAGAPASWVPKRGRHAGAVYVFRRDGSHWSDGKQTAKLLPARSRDSRKGRLGATVAIDGDVIVAGAPGSWARKGKHAGAVLVFARRGERWSTATPTARLTASEGRIGDRLGASLLIDAGVVVASAPQAGQRTRKGRKRGPGEGASYVFAKPAGSWTDATETARVSAVDADPFANLGASVAMDGDTIVAGAPGGAGAVYVFAKAEGGWTSATQTARLSIAGAGADDRLGHSVAIDGDTIVAGAPSTDRSGAVFVFEKPRGGWADATETAKLATSSALAGLGTAVGIDGATIVAGTGADTAVVYVKPGGGWRDGTETARLTAADSGDTGLGVSVAVAGDTIVAGAPDAGQQRGAVFVFLKPTGGWRDVSHSAKLVSSDASGFAHLGSAVDVGKGGKTVVAGAPSYGGGDYHDAEAVSTGAVYLFAEPTGGWAGGELTERARLTASDAGAGSALGHSVAIGGDTDDVVIAGAPQDQEHGSAYLFRKAGPDWVNAVEDERRASNVPRDGDFLGSAVALDGETAAVGAPGRDVSVADQGAAYVYAVPPSDSTPPDSDAPRFVAAPGLIDFGELLPFDRPRIATVAVVNTGTSTMPALVISAPEVPDYTVERDGCASTRLAPGAECVIDIGFSPRRAGGSSAVLDVRAGEVVESVELRGRSVSQTVTISPAVCPPGCVAQISGFGFPPGTSIRVLADTGPKRAVEAGTNALGEFTTPFVVFPRSAPGRLILVSTAVGTPIKGTVDLLVVRGTLNPPDFNSGR